MERWDAIFFKHEFETLIHIYRETREGKISLLHRELELWKRTTAPDGVLVYGAGGVGRIVLGALEKLGISVKAFMDADPGRQKKDLLGCPVLSPLEAGKNFSGSLPVVIAIDISELKPEFFAIASLLRSHGFKRILHWSFLREYSSIVEYDLLHNYMLHSPEDVIASRDDILRVSEMLADDFSREALYKIIRSRLLGSNMPMECWFNEDGIYFHEDLFAILPDEVFIDCGAYDGDTLRVFYRRYPDKLRQYHAYEPFPKNIDAIAALVKENEGGFADRVRIHACVLGDTHENAVLCVNNLNSFGGRVVESSDAGYNVSLGITSNAFCVPTRRIDDEDYEYSPTFIKMDVEGSELNILKGAEKTIRAATPLMAVSIYHSSHDLWTLPLLLKDYMPAARIAIRCNHPFYDTVCYAIPENRWR